MCVAFFRIKVKPEAVFVLVLARILLTTKISDVTCDVEQSLGGDKHCLSFTPQCG